MSASSEQGRSPSRSERSEDDAQVTRGHVSRVRWLPASVNVGALAERLLRDHGAKCSVYEHQHGREVVARLCGKCWEPICMRGQMGKGEAWFRLDMLVQCRRCRWCLHQRRRMWVARAMREIASSGRTWMVTLTVQPFWRYNHVANARAEAGHQWAGMSKTARKRAELEKLLATFSLWMKRFRMRSVRRAGADERPKPKIKFVAVAEEHPSSGEWHLHVLIHEKQGQIREEDIRHTWWPVGFAHAKLVKQAIRGALYVCWYISKSEHNARLRSSMRYGAVEDGLNAA